MKDTALLIAGVFLALNVTSSAAPLVYEGFNYGAVIGNLSGQNGGTGWETAWDTTTPPVSGTNPGFAQTGPTSATYGPLATTGGYTELRTSGPTVFGISIFRDLASTLGGAGSDLWLSFLTNNNVPNSGLSLINSGATGNTTMLSIGDYVGLGGYGVSWSGGINQPVATGTSSSFGVASGASASLLVLHLNMNTGSTPIYTAWLNPNVSSLGTGTAPTGGTQITLGNGTQPFAFDRVNLAMNTGVNPRSASFDEIRIGNTWTDVSPIPEPATGLMLLAGLGMVAGIRRRTAQA